LGGVAAGVKRKAKKDETEKTGGSRGEIDRLGDSC